MKNQNKQQRRLSASNAAHKRLQNRAIRKNDERKQIYHGSCIISQENVGRVLSLGERKKIYGNVVNHVQPPKAPPKPKNKPKRNLDWSSWFDFDERGRIKGSYTCDGFFEPD